MVRGHRTLPAEAPKPLAGRIELRVSIGSVDGHHVRRAGRFSRTGVIQSRKERRVPASMRDAVYLRKVTTATKTGDMRL